MEAFYSDSASCNSVVSANGGRTVAKEGYIRGSVFSMSAQMSAHQKSKERAWQKLVDRLARQSPEAKAGAELKKILAVEQPEP
jgi:hypothetical protein